ncbi:MAG: hypothetical protein MK110_14705 [Fuerstiella sp.]|nr:hypothetical protein [Fuerstiella sp.]
MRRIPLTLTASLLSLLILGCSDSTSGTSTLSPDHTGQHDHGEEESHSGHDHPGTLEEGLKELTELRDTVRDAFAADDIDTAHGPLHDVGHLLEDIAALVERQELSDEQRDLVKKNIKSLFDLFGAVDSTLHGDEGKTYSEVSDQIDTALSALREATLSVGAPNESTESADSLGNQAEEE